MFLSRGEHQTRCQKSRSLLAMSWTGMLTTPSLRYYSLPALLPRTDDKHRNFIWWVEQAFRARGLTCDMLFLNPRLQLSAVVKRQVLEGVQAVVFLNRSMQLASKISIQVFDRRGEGEASFDRKSPPSCLTTLIPS